MKFKSFAIIIAVTIMIVSCGKDDDGNGPTGPGDEETNVIPGAWSGTNMKFFVASDSSKLTKTGSTLDEGASMIIKISIDPNPYGVATITFYRYGDIPINSEKLNYEDDKLKVDGEFLSEYEATGTASCETYNSAHNYTFTGSGTWNASPTTTPGTAEHNAGLLTLMIDDVGGAEGWRNTFIWPNTGSIDHLYWNWLAVGYSDTHVSDGSDNDWFPAPGGEIVIVDSGSTADQEGYAQYQHSANYLEITQESYAWANHPHNDYIIIKYSIKNTGTTTLSSVYAGHRSDFDVMGDHGGSPTDMSDFDQTRTLGYMWDTSSTWHMGVKLLQGNFRGYHQGWHGSSESEKYNVLSSSGIDPTTPSANDWCFWLSVGPYSIAPGNSVIAAYAFLAGETLQDLQANADSAQSKWNSLGN
ncbi:MAG: hypothetical protein IMY70_01825 [Bacteroidetes bacterium]|nr:hypothetical protein [Bacteroidota bacterium]